MRNDERQMTAKEYIVARRVKAWPGDALAVDIVEPRAVSPLVRKTPLARLLEERQRQRHK